MSGIAKKLGKFLYEVICFLVFFTLSSLLTIPLVEKMIRLSVPSSFSEEQIKEYIKNGPGAAMWGGALSILFLVLFYLARRYIVKKWSHKQ